MKFAFALVVATLIAIVSAGKDTGSCGDSCEWVYDDKKLKITGSGEMDNFSWSNPVPWKEFEHKVLTIKVFGVSSIGKEAFSGCKVAETVTISNVTVIHKSAFSGLSALTSVTFNDDDLEVIDDSAFEGCSSLESFTISKNVKSISYSSFRLCSGMKAFSVSEDSSDFETDDNGALYDTGKTTLYFFPPNSEATTFVIPDTVTSIKTYALQGCNKLTSITIPEDVSYLSEAVLFGCTGLSSINVADGNTNFEIVDGALLYGSTLVKYPGKREGDTFAIPQNVRYVYSYAFEGASNLKSIEIHKDVTSLPNGEVFNGCTDMEEFIVDPENTLLQAVDGVLFKNFSSHNYLYKYPAKKSGTTYTVPGNTTYVIGYAFDSVSELETLVFENPVEMIGSSAFFSCPNLSSIEYPFEKNPGSSASIVDCPKLEKFCKTENYKDSLFLGMKAVNCDASSMVIPSVLVMVVMAIFARFF